MTLFRFFTSFLSSAYSLHCVELSTHTMQLYRPSLPDAGYHSETFQDRVGQLGRLAAYIAFDSKIATQPRVEQARLRLESLNEWHRTLPPFMQLGRLNRADAHTIPWYTKRSLLQLHMLFLGLFNEPYRSCLADVGRSRLSDPSSESEDLESMKNIETQCVSAARQCARVVSLLQMDNLIRSHCWVSVYVDHDVHCSTSSDRVLVLDIPASLAALYSSSVLHKNYSCWMGKTSAKTYHLHLHT
jgi:hypothetical protein